MATITTRRAANYARISLDKQEEAGVKRQIHLDDFVTEVVLLRLERADFSSYVLSGDHFNNLTARLVLKLD